MSATEKPGYILQDKIVGPAFLDDEGPSVELPPHITTKNIREMYGWQLGETLEEAIARRDEVSKRKVKA